MKEDMTKGLAAVLLRILGNPLIVANRDMSIDEIREIADDDPDLAGWISELAQATNEANALVSKLNLGGRPNVVLN